MTNTRLVTIAVVMTTVILASTGLLLAAGECDDDPALCAGSRSWIEDFDEDPMIASPDDWQQRNGTQAMPEYDGGMAIFDGLVDPWMLIDSADHFFEGETRIHIVMDANPVDGPDLGAGWWVNVDNDAQQGGYYAINGMLARNDDGEQEYVFGPGWAGVSEIIPVAEGGVDVSVILLPDEDEELLNVIYSITDAVETHEGEFEVFGAQGGNQVTADKWFSLVANNSGSGAIDFVEVINQPNDLLGDYNNNGELDAADLDLQASAIVGGQNPTEFDLNGDSVVDFDDRLIWVNDLKKTWVGDSNLDLEFNSGDMVQVFAKGKYEEDDTASWEDGDWNGDTWFNSADMVAAFAGGGYEKGKKPAVSAVPEPGSATLLLLASLPLLTRRRR